MCFWLALSFRRAYDTMGIRSPVRTVACGYEIGSMNASSTSYRSRVLYEIMIEGHSRVIICEDPPPPPKKKTNLTIP